MSIGLYLPSDIVFVLVVLLLAGYLAFFVGIIVCVARLPQMSDDSDEELQLLGQRRNPLRMTISLAALSGVDMYGLLGSSSTNDSPATQVDSALGTMTGRSGIQ